MSENLYQDAWNYALDELHKKYISEDRESEFLFNFNINYVSDDKNIITVSVQSPFMKNQVTSKGSLNIIQNKIREITGLDNLTLDCIIKNESKPSEEKNKNQKEDFKDEDSIKNSSSEEDNIHTEPVKEFKKHPQLDDRYIFENFIPGDNSMFAYNAAISVAKEPGKARNPILFYGGSGLGKTHLMQAIGHYIYNQNPKLKICYVQAESFTNEFLDSLKTKKTNDFKNKYRNLDVLLLDDIHFLQGKESTQEELFYTFNALFAKKAQMVFTCDRPIREIKDMAERLVSRLNNGLSIDIQVPKFENRYAILQKKIEMQGKTLAPEIIEYIAKNIETNVRELESALVNIFSYEELTGQPLNLEIVKTLLRDFIRISTGESVSLDKILKVVADAYQISVADLKGKKKDKKYAVPRQISIYIAREMTEISYMELGNEYSGKDHSTMMYAYNKISDLLKTDPSLESRIKNLMREIKEYNK
jgi:chromosomal replication initiator protein